MRKKIEVVVDGSYGTTHLLAGIKSKNNWRCNVFKGLLVTGYLTAPPDANPLSLSTYWAWLRYASAFKTVPSLRLNDKWSELDPHQKTILSDDFGLGFPAFYLMENHGFEDFANTQHLINNQLKDFVSPIKRPARGPAKAPDFIAVDSAGELHILECKGTQSSRKDLLNAAILGVDQKNNLSGLGAKYFKSSMVGGIFVPQADSKEKAQILFLDPEPDDDLLKIKQLPKKLVASAIRRQSLAKCLAMSGLSICANGLNSQRVNSTTLELIRNMEKIELSRNNFEESETSWRKTISIQTVSEGTQPSRNYAIEFTIEMPKYLIEIIRSSFYNDGTLIIDYIDYKLDKLASKNREHKITKKENEIDEKKSTEQNQEQTKESTGKIDESTEIKKASIAPNEKIQPQEQKANTTKEREMSLNSGALTTSCGISFSIKLNDL